MRRETPDSIANGRDGGAEAPAIARRELVVAFVVAFAVVVLLRWRAIATPYFWDEVGYYIPNAVSMYRNHLFPIPDRAVPQSYPPLQPYLLVFGWWVFGFSIAATRIVCFAAAAGALTAVFACARAVFGREVAIVAAIVTLANPVFFGQAGFAQPETLLAAFTAAATLTIVRGRTLAHGVWIVLMLATKWTSVVALPAFAIFAYLTAPDRREGLRRQLAYVPGVLLLAAWLIFFRLETGSFASPSSRYTQVNLWDNLDAATLAGRFVVRAEQLLWYDASWLLVAPAIGVAVWWWVRRRARPIERDRARSDVLLMVALCGSYLVFLAVSGFLLSRYFVPVQPFVAMLGTAAVYRVCSLPMSRLAMCAIACTIHLGWYGLYPGPRLIDASSAYYDLVATHVAAARWIETTDPQARVAANWLVVGELSEPVNGYVHRPIATIDVDALPADDSALGSFDLVYEAPAPGSVDTAGDIARRLGLFEVARFEAGDQVTVLWRAPSALGSQPRTLAAPER